MQGNPEGPRHGSKSKKYCVSAEIDQIRDVETNSKPKGGKGRI